MRKILNDEMVDTIFKFAKKFNDLEISDLEMGILGAVRLTAAGTSCFTNIYIWEFAYTSWIAE